jgi:hypothetical protein
VVDGARNMSLIVQLKTICQEEKFHIDPPLTQIGSERENSLLISLEFSGVQLFS